MGLPPYFSPIRIVSLSRRTILLILLHNQIYPSIPTNVTAAVSSMPGSCHSSQFKGRQNRIMFALIIMYVSLPSQTAALCILRCVLPFILNPPLFVFDLCRLFLCSATHIENGTAESFTKTLFRYRQQAIHKEEYVSDINYRTQNWKVTLVSQVERSMRLLLF